MKIIVVYKSSYRKYKVNIIFDESLFINDNSMFNSINDNINNK